jgi:hypothetical protein
MMFVMNEAELDQFSLDEEDSNDEMKDSSTDIFRKGSENNLPVNQSIHGPARVDYQNQLAHSADPKTWTIEYAPTYDRHSYNPSYAPE